MGEFISVNPNLRSTLGHSIHQDRCLRIEAERRGWSFSGLVHKECSPEVASEGVYTPTFGVMMHQLARDRSRNRFRLAERVAREWVEGYDLLVEARGGVDRGEEVYFQYLGHSVTLPFLAELMGSRLVDAPGARIVINLFSGYFECPLDQGGEREFLEAGIAVGCAESVPWLRVVTDSSRLASDMERVTGWILPVLPMMPSQTFFPSQIGFGTVPLRGLGQSRKRKVEVVFPTHAEASRGFDFLRDWVAGTESSASWRSDIHLTIRQHAPWRTDLTRQPSGDGSVTWIEGDLSEVEYRRLLAEADVVLLPYSPIDFQYRTSSILAEAFSLGKPIICVEGSWLAEQVRSVNGGWVLPELSVAALEDVLGQVVAERDRIRPWPGTEAMEEWLSVNSVPAFLSAVLGDLRPQGELDASRLLPLLWENPGGDGI